jgi:hypothetical protein
MSEYQYYEWQTIDCPLTAEEQAAVNRLSSHIDVTSTCAVVTYNWGDFKHNAMEVLGKYFDAFLYHFNWGSARLAFRFPKNLLDPIQIGPYVWDNNIELEPVGEYLILSIARTTRTITATMSATRLCQRWRACGMISWPATFGRSISPGCEPPNWPALMKRLSRRRRPA